MSWENRAVGNNQLPQLGYELTKTNYSYWFAPVCHAVCQLEPLLVASQLSSGPTPGSSATLAPRDASSIFTCAPPLPPVAVLGTLPRTQPSLMVTMQKANLQCVTIKSCQESSLRTSLFFDYIDRWQRCNDYDRKTCATMVQTLAVPSVTPCQVRMISAALAEG